MGWGQTRVTYALSDALVLKLADEQAHHGTEMLMCSRFLQTPVTNRRLWDLSNLVVLRDI